MPDRYLNFAGPRLAALVNVNTARAPANDAPRPRSAPATLSSSYERGNTRVPSRLCPCRRGLRTDVYAGQAGEKRSIDLPRSVGKIQRSRFRRRRPPPRRRLRRPRH